MGDAADEFNSGLRRVVVTQLLLTALLAAGFFVFHDRPTSVADALAACYGGTVTVLISAWLGWRMKVATRSARRMAAARGESAGPCGERDVVEVERTARAQQVGGKQRHGGVAGAGGAEGPVDVSGRRS